MKKIGALLMAATCFCSITIAGCAGETANSTDSSPEKDLTAGKESIYVEKTSFEKTDINLVNNGTSDYAIVIPDKATAMEKYASSELQYFLSESTGVTLPILLDSAVVKDNSKCYLSVGETSLLENQTDINIDFDVLGESGVTVIRKDKTVYLSGAANYGTLYSVYKFLEFQIGFKAYTVDCVVYDYYNQLKLLDFDYQYVPLVAKMGTGMIHTTDPMLEELARMYSVGAVRTGPAELFEGQIFDGLFCHTNMFIVDQAKYPHLYKNNQICYTSEEALAVFSENLYQRFLNSPSMDRINLGINDYPSSCDCEKCVTETEKYGGGGVLLRFCNQVAAYLDEKFEGKRQITLVPLMYYHYIEPPVTKTAEGKYAAIDETCYPRTGMVSVKVMFAPIESCYYHSFADPCEVNEQNREWLLGWRALTNDFYMYTYESNFPGPATFFNNLSYMSETFKWFYENDIRFTYIYGNRGGGSLNVFDDLKFYVRNRLYWNPTLNLEDIIDEFMENCYGVGGEYVKEYYYASVNHIKYVYTMRNTECIYPLTTITNGLYWPRQTLLNFEGMLNKAIEEINAYDYTEADKIAYTERVNRELYLVRLNLYNYYKSYYTGADLIALENYFAAYANDPKYHVG